MFELSQTNRNTTQVANDQDNNTQGKLMFAFLAFIYILTLYSFYAWGDVLLPEAASAENIATKNVTNITQALAGEVARIGLVY